MTAVEAKDPCRIPTRFLLPSLRKQETLDRKVASSRGRRRIYLLNQFSVWKRWCDMSDAACTVQSFGCLTCLPPVPFGGLAPKIINNLATKAFIGLLEFSCFWFMRVKSEELKVGPAEGFSTKAQVQAMPGQAQAGILEAQRHRNTVFLPILPPPTRGRPCAYIRTCTKREPTVRFASSRRRSPPGEQLLTTVVAQADVKHIRFGSFECAEWMAGSNRGCIAVHQHEHVLGLTNTSGSTTKTFLLGPYGAKFTKRVRIYSQDMTDVMPRYNLSGL